MRFLNLARAEALPEDHAVAARLHAIVGRGQAELSLYKAEAQPADFAEPHDQEKCFWTPAEVAAEDAADPEG